MLAMSAVRVVTDDQVEAINYYLALFFFICRTPSAVIGSCTFRKFAYVLNPAYEKKMQHPSALHTTHLADMYDETVVETAEMLAARPGKIMLGIDGQRTCADATS